MSALAKKQFNIRELISKLGVFLALFILCVVLAIASDNFLTIPNMMNILRQTSINALIATGMLLCLITGGIDLSVGANAVTCTCVMGAFIQRGITNPLILIAAALITGTLVGFLNGLLLTKLSLPHPFVSTLGMKNVLSGLALLVVNSQSVAIPDSAVTYLGSANIFATDTFGGFPVSFLVVIVVFMIFSVFLNRTVLGRHIYCAGGNREASRLSGIPTGRVLNSVYTISGFMCALAGIMLAGRTGIAAPASAIQPYDTDAIAACIIGGASFAGGKGNMSGTLIGALLISVLRNGLDLLHADSAMQYIILGLVIIIAVTIDVVRTRADENARRKAGIK